MNKLSILLIITMLVFGCTFTQNEQKQVKKTTTKKVVKEIKKENIYPKLTSKTAVDFLTKYGKENPENRVIFETPYGDIKIKLYDETPLHRANFIMLIKRKYFAQTLLHRVVLGHAIQGGGSDEQSVYDTRKKIGNYKLPAEINNMFFHKKGALAMARHYENNPKKRSSAYEFYIVHGVPLVSTQLANLSGYKKNEYAKLGGTPHLDGDFTVFGEVIEGLQYVDSLALVETDAREWPLVDIPVKLSVVK